jgi:beta-adrenergic-receptor kinase
MIWVYALCLCSSYQFNSKLFFVCLPLCIACKKGTSGKLYAMKVMNKRRIKLKKSEQLALNERQALAAVESKFVISLSYSFQSPTDVYLILDLMTGGDLGFHLHQRGCFSKRECIYYTARIMLGLQHLHDKNYVYRDLKPENCLLSDDGRVKITDLGLAVQMTSTLHGAAGTRGYWAPEMLRRDSVSGKRCTYDHMVDWFSLGCCLAEFISGSNPFRSERALLFGTDKGKLTKEKAIDCATLEMEPEFRFESGFDLASADLCKRLLDKNEKTRLGGADNIVKHDYFAGVNWDSIIQDKKKPPFVPAKDVNAASQSEIGTFAEDKSYQETVLTAKDHAFYSDWDWTNSRSYTTEVLEFLVYERQTGEPLVPLNEHGNCCCGIS